MLHNISGSTGGNAGIQNPLRRGRRCERRTQERAGGRGRPRPGARAGTARGARGFERTSEASGQMAVLVDIAAAVRPDKPSRQVFAGRAGVMVLFGVVDEVLPSEQAALGVARCQCLWRTGQHAVFSHANNRSPLK
jgi:hypothetical protein